MLVLFSSVGQQRGSNMTPVNLAGRESVLIGLLRIGLIVPHLGQIGIVTQDCLLHLDQSNNPIL